eukprot:6180357-Pleurochrysis_carterae.AAC.3
MVTLSVDCEQVVLTDVMRGEGIVSREQELPRSAVTGGHRTQISSSARLAASCLLEESARERAPRPCRAHTSSAASGGTRRTAQAKKAVGRAGAQAVLDQRRANSRVPSMM